VGRRLDLRVLDRQLALGNKAFLQEKNNYLIKNSLATLRIWSNWYLPLLIPNAPEENATVYK